MSLARTHVLWPLFQLAETDPDKIIFSFVNDQGQNSEKRTVSQFVNRIETLAGYLQTGCHLKKGDVALLIYPPSMEFVETFAACLLAGIIAAPVYPPNLARPGNDLERLRAIAEQSQAKAMLTNRTYRWATRVQSAKELLTNSGGQWPDLPWYVTQGLSWFVSKIKNENENWDCQNDVAVLQFTSGSTSLPKGVQITHKNLNHQLEYNAEVLSMNADSKLVMWVPQYHDLGLISGILSILQGNGSLYFMSPLSFLKTPALWFETIHKVRATHTAAPNFGYELVTRKTTAEMRAQWDLSCLKVVMSAAEPIVPKTVDSFLEAFSVSKLSPHTFCPAYGLAEHTVGITIGGKSRIKIDRTEAVEKQVAIVKPASDYEIMGCGFPGFGIQVRIVSPNGNHVLKENHIGEICAQSDSVANGYMGQEDLNKEFFEFTLEGEQGHWLRTGDLGFLHKGELFVTGRQKDLVIIRGKNFQPETIEESIRYAHADIRPGGVVAFSVPGTDTEKLVVLLEVTDTSISHAEEIARAVKKKISEVWQLQATVGIAAPHTVKKTTSGKLQRSLCRKLWMENQFSLVTFEEQSVQSLLNSPSDESRGISEQLMEIPVDDRLDYVIQSILNVALTILPEGVSRIGVDDFLPDAGLDSLTIFDLITALEEKLKHPLPQELFIEHPTLRSAATRILSDLGIECVGGEKREAPLEKPFEFRPKHRGMVPAQTRIGIVGAGVGGLISALELARLGYKNITIFESDAKCGGKVTTETQEHELIELGQNVLMDSFHVLLQLAKDLKCKINPVSASFLFWEEKYGFEQSPSRSTYRNWVKLVLKAARVEANTALPLPQLLNDLDGSFENFLNKHHLNPPHPLFFFEWNAMGYGMDLKIPASYVISYLQTLGTSGNVCYLADGNQSLWTKLADHLEKVWGVTILQNHSVTSIQTKSEIVNLFCNEKKYEFDEIILSAPPTTLKKILPKDDPLQELIMQFGAYTFFVDSFKATGLPECGCFFFPEWASSVGKVVGAQLCRGNTGWYISGQYVSSFEENAKSVSEQDLKKEISGTVEKMGGQVTEYGPSRTWTYFPHTRNQPSQTLRKAESLQGTRHIWTTGSWISFETTEQVARHAQHLIRTCFDPAGGEMS